MRRQARPPSRTRGTAVTAEARSHAATTRAVGGVGGHGRSIAAVDGAATGPPLGMATCMRSRWTNFAPAASQAERRRGRGARRRARSALDGRPWTRWAPPSLEPRGSASARGQLRAGRVTARGPAADPAARDDRRHGPPALGRAGHVRHPGDATHPSAHPNAGPRIVTMRGLFHPLVRTTTPDGRGQCAAIRTFHANGTG